MSSPRRASRAVAFAWAVTLILDAGATADLDREGLTYERGEIAALVREWRADPACWEELQDFARERVLAAGYGARS